MEWLLVEIRLFVENVIHLNLLMVIKNYAAGVKNGKLYQNSELVREITTNDVGRGVKNVKQLIRNFIIEDIQKDVPKNQESIEENIQKE